MSDAGGAVPSAWATAGLYVFCASLVVWPAVDLVTNTWPLQIGNFEWRYGFAGLLGGFHLTPLFGFSFALALGVWLEHPGVLRALSVCALCAALFLVVVLVLFPLDALQVRGVRAPSVVPAIVVGATIAEAKHLTAAVTYVLLGVGAWKMSGRASTDSGAGKGAAGVVVGSGKKPRKKR